MLLKHAPNAEDASAVPFGISLYPTPFPRKQFEQAEKLQTIYNRLYMAVSEDEEWLHDVLKG